jgi:phosphoribosylglycinamide formyltransferase-1
MRPADLRLVLLTSRAGGHCMHIAEELAAGRLPGLQLVAIVTENPQAPVIDRCRQRGLPWHLVPWRGAADRAAHERELNGLLESLRADLVGLVGYLKLVGPTLLAHWRGRMFNLHPSPLPDFPGLNAIERAYAAGARRYGATVHWVDEGCDTGAPIVQGTFEPPAGATLSELTARVHRLEQQLLSDALRLLAAVIEPRAAGPQSAAAQESLKWTVSNQD